MDGDLPEDNSSSAGASTSSRIMGPFPLLQAIRCSARSPSLHPFQVSGFFLLGLSTGHSCVASVQHDLATLACLACSSCFFFISRHKWRN